MKLILTIFFVVAFHLSEAQNSSDVIVRDSVDYTFVDELPTFTGGDSSFADYIRKNFVFSKYLKDEGLVAATFLASVTINKEGKLTEDSIVAYDPMIGIIKTIMERRDGNRGKAFENHLLEILESSPIWTPGKYNGEAIAVRIIMNIYINSGVNSGNKDVKINNVS